MSRIWYTHRHVCSCENKKNRILLVLSLSFLFVVLMIRNVTFDPRHVRHITLNPRLPPSPGPSTKIQTFVRTLNIVLGCREHQKCFWHVTGKKPICCVKTTGNAIGK